MFSVNEAKKLQIQATLAKGGLPAFHGLLGELSAGMPTELA